MAQAGTGLIEELTPREREVLELLRLGRTNGEIARRLSISPDGAKYHVAEIIGKLGVRSRYEASAWPERPPWWLGAVAPVGLLLRQLRTLWLGPVAATGAGVAVAAAIGVLVWGLVRTDGDGASTVTAPTDAVARVEPIMLGEGLFGGTDWSPDGRSVAFVVQAALYRAEAPEFTPQQLLPEGGEYGVAIREPRWSPDGTRIAFLGSHEFQYPNGETLGMDTIWMVNADGTGLVDLLPGDKAYLSTGTAAKIMQDWLDNDTLAFDQHCGTGCQQPYVIESETGDLEPVGVEGSLWTARNFYAPNGRWIAGDYPFIMLRDTTSGERTILDKEGSAFQTFDAWAPDSSAFLYQETLPIETDEGCCEYSQPFRLSEYNVAAGESRLVAAGGKDGAYSQNGSLIAYLTEATDDQPCGGAPDCIAVIDAATGEERYRVPGPGADALVDPFVEFGLRFLRDGRLIYFDLDGDVWLVADGVRELLLDVDSVLGLDVSPDGRSAVVGELGRVQLVPIPPQ